MPHLSPPGPRLAAVAALLLLLAGLALRHRRGGAALREASVVLGLDAVWGALGLLSRGDLAAAQRRAARVRGAEALLHLDVEHRLQALVLPHRLLVQAANGYYLYGHLNTIVLLLVWVWWRHRDAYPRLRATLVLLTATSFAVQLVPVAPPRLLPGYVDTAARYGQSVYGSFAQGLPSQLLAMPSLHVGWAVLAAAAVVRLSRHRLRWLAVLHPVLMALVVVCTGNHWVLDVVAALALLALSAVAARHLPARALAQPAGAPALLAVPT